MFASWNSETNNYSLMVRLFHSGYSLHMNEEGTEISVRSLQCLCMKFKKMHTMQDLSRKPRPRLLTEEMVFAKD